MLSKYDFEKLADHVSDELIKHNRPLDKTIKIISIEMKMNPEQIKRLTESSNIKTYNKMFDALEDKTFTFDVADSKKIIDDIYSDSSDKKDGTTTEIKDMPPVQYDAKVNPKKPQVDFEFLGDTPEIEISKNTQNSEDSASDNFIDSLKIPKKDYSYEENPIKNEKENNAEGDSDSEEDNDEEKLKKNLKEASLKEEKIAQVGDLRKELLNRILILDDNIADSYTKLASLFRGVNRNEKFTEFVKNASAFYDSTEISPLVKSLVDTCKIDTKITISGQKNKFASEKGPGFSQLKDYLYLVNKRNKTAQALKVLSAH